MLKCRLFYVVHMLSLGSELELIVMAIIPTTDFKKKRNATCRSKSRKVEVAVTDLLLIKSLIVLIFQDTV